MTEEKRQGEFELKEEIAKSLSRHKIIKYKQSSRLFVLMIEALIKGRKVQMPEIAMHLDSEVKIASNIRRIERFFEKVAPNYDALCHWFIDMLPEGKVTLCMDRTTWKTGKEWVNVLAVTAYSQGVGVPLYFEMLPSEKKGGNSSCKERMAFMDRLLELLPAERINCLIADREFIGKDWINQLADKGVTYYIRVACSHKIRIGDKELKGEQWLKEYGSISEKEACVFGLDVRVSITMSRDKDGCSDPLIVITNATEGEIIPVYTKRWSIEVFFQSVKGRGFDLESTNLRSMEKLRKLFALVSVAFTICHFFGEDYNEKVQSIEIKKMAIK